MTRRAQIEAAFARFARLMIRARWAVIAGMLGITVALGSLIPQVRVDNSDEAFLRADDPARVAYDEFQEMFGREDRAFILFHPADVFDLEFLELLRRIHREIEEKAPYVEEVTSLVNARNTYGDGDTLIVEDLLEDWPETPQDLAVIRERVLANPLLVNTLISDTERLTVISIKPFTYSTLDPEIDALEGFDDEADDGARPNYLTPEESTELVLALREIVEPYRASGVPIFVTGGLAIDHALNTIMTGDMVTTFPISIALILGILLLLFRRISGAVLPIVVVVASVTASLGTMVLLEIPFSVTLNVLPALLLTVGICDAIHILAIFYQRLTAGDSREDAIAFAVGHSGLAVVMTSLTTAAGLFSFVTAKLTAVQHLGLIAPLGVLAAMVYSLTLLPALLAVVPVRARARRRGRLEGLVVDRFLLPLGDVATRFPGGVLACSGLLLLICGIGAAQLRFSHDGIRWFPEDDRIRMSAELMDDEFKGTSSLEVVVSTGRENGLHEPETLARLERAMRFSESLAVGPESVSKATSIVDVVKEINQALNANAADAYVVPEGRRLIAQELLLFENSGSDDLEDVTDSLFETARVSIRTPWVDAIVYPDFVEAVRTGFGEILGPELPFELTGGATIFSSLFKAVTISMARSYGLALLIITPLLVLLVGSVKRGLIAMIPNLIPIYVTLALMGWLDIPIDMSTLLIGGVILGVAVDDTIHFMHKFNRYYQDTGDPQVAVRQTLATTGTALLFTSLVLCAGFGVFMTTYMVNTVWFGLLTAFATVVAFLADVIVAPALMVWVSPKRAA